MTDDTREPVDWATCWVCEGQGLVLTCPDDLCQVAGECMHGDGESICGECKGTGEVPIYEDDHAE